MRSWPVCLVAAVAVPTSSNAASSPQDARTLLASAIVAQGGEAALQRLATITVRARGIRYMLEQSERPEGPWIVEYNDQTEVRDHAHDRYVSVTESEVPPGARYRLGVVTDGRTALRLSPAGLTASTREALTAGEEAMMLSPERLLLTAKAAADLHLDSVAELQGLTQDTLAFTLHGSVVRIYLNPFTHLPTAMDFDGALARTGYWQRLGDVRMRVYFSRWAVGPGGIRMPMQLDTDRNGLRDSTYSVTSIDIGETGSHTDLVVTSDLAAAFVKAAANHPQGAPLGRADQPMIEEAAGITVIPGSWNVTIVRQQDGVVVVEAPISSEYSEKVIAEVGRRYPGVPITAVVSTSDSWPHIAGLRPYVARGIPIYAPELNRPIISQLVASSYASKPDRLQARPMPLRFVPIGDGVEVGSGPNRVALYPLRGEASERQAIAYWPEHHLLYGSDPFQTVELSEEALELEGAVTREGLTPRRFYMMHILPQPWKNLINATADLNAARFPASSQR